MGILETELRRITDKMRLSRMYAREGRDWWLDEQHRREIMDEVDYTLKRLGDQIESLRDGYGSE
jgi:hypothetical protein